MSTPAARRGHPRRFGVGLLALALALVADLGMPARSVSAADARSDTRPAVDAGLTAPDFDADGYADLAVGAPYTRIRAKAAGAVHVLHGSASGLRTDRRQVWSQASAGIADDPERGDQFGWSIATADFDGDGYSDLAIGARWERRAGWHAGAVHVLHGSAEGLTSDGSQLWTQDSPGIADRAERGDAFGTTLVAADLDGDGYGDLVIGTPLEDRRGRDTGIVHILYGSRAGLRAQRSEVWHQDTPGVPDRPEAGDHFGRSLTAGDFDGDGRADLAIGVPYESRRAHRMGIVHVLRGTRDGLTARGSQVWHQDAPGVAERAELRDQFGQSLASGDFDADGFDDLIAGAWFEDYRNRFSNEGGFHVLYGSRSGLRATRDRFWHQDRRGTRDRTHISDNFGQALAVGDLDGDGVDDLAVGIPSADRRVDVHSNRGAVHVFFGSRGGITAAGDRYLHQDSRGVPGRSARFDHLGSAVAISDLDGDGVGDLVVAIPWKDARAKDAGAIIVLTGSRRGPRLIGSRLLTARGSGLARSAWRGGRFGWSLSSSSPRGDTSRTSDPRN